MENKFKKGDRVMYRAYKGAIPEYGIVERATDKFVFVRYVRHGRLSGNSEATRPEVLAIASGSKMKGKK